MTPEERILLQNVGSALLYNLSGYTTFILLQGVFFGTFSAFVLQASRRGFSARPTKILLATSFAALVFGAMGMAANIVIEALEIKGPLIDSGGALDSTLIDHINDKLVAPQLLSEWSDQLQLLISDSIVIWRAWVLYPGQRWIMLLPLLLLAGTFGSSLGFLIVETNPVLNAATHEVNGGETVDALLSNIAVFFSLATNALATFLIIAKLWMHRRFLGRLMVGRKKLSSGSRAMLLLAESGIFFCLVQVISIVGVYLPISSTDVHAAVNGVATGALFGLSGMYPLVVILLISEKRSEIQTFGFSTALKNHGAANPNAPLNNVEMSHGDIELAARDEIISDADPAARS